MKIFICIFSLMILICSCNKEDRILFHGKVTADCNNQQSIVNATVSVYRHFLNGSGQSELLGSDITDSDGNYSLIVKENDIGEFQYYEFKILVYFPGNRISISSCYSYESSDNIENNCQITPRKMFAFHIKNNNPFDNNDALNSLLIGYGIDDMAFLDTVTSDLTGVAVDETIYVMNAYSLTPIITYTKNGIISNLVLPTVTNTNCEDTLSVDVFY